MTLRAWKLGVAFGCILAAALALARQPAFATEGGGGGGGEGNEPGGLIRPGAPPAGAFPRPARPTATPRPARPTQTRPARPTVPQATARQATRSAPKAAPARSARSGATVQRQDGRPPSGETRFVQDEVLALLASGVEPQALAQLEQAQSLTRLSAQPIGLLGASLNRYRLAPGRTVTQAIAALRADRRVALAQPNYLFTLQQAVSVAAAPMAQYAVDKMRLRKAHETATGASVSIAVIDSLIDAEHPELKGAITKQFDAFDAPTLTVHAHGTAIAGLIGGRDKLTGAAPRANLLAVVAFAPASATYPASGSSWRIIRGLDWAVDAGARIVNLSFAGPQDPLLGRALVEAHKRGVALIAASGNAGPQSPPLYPAADKNVIAVTATDATDRLYERASGGRHVAFAAPGVDVLTAGPKASYDLATGTSMAAAYVSGVAALIIEKNPKANPADILAALRRSLRAAPGAKPIDVKLIDAPDALAIDVTAAAKPAL